ncbi:lipid A export ATP-binding/permease protein MsbA [mine drainage metagenome]|uniref:Lipid A export ATP-binding/permease protein MsbA n=1 Tax=mine drainage metagenome TaxID=410659 RepID=A0A1J5R9K7_9ZZZZ
MIGILRKFLALFGQGFYRSILMVFLADVLNGALELMGVLLIFPLMTLVDDPGATRTRPSLSWLYHLMGEPDPRYVVLAISLAIAGVYLFRSFVQVGVLNMENHVLSRWKNVICCRLFKAYMVAPYTFHVQRNSSVSIEMLSYVVVTAINNYIFRAILFFSNIVVAVFLLGFLFFTHPVVSIVVGVLFYSFFKLQKRFINKRVACYSHEMVTQSQKNMSALQQGIAAYRETKINLKEAYFTRMFSEANRRVMEIDGRIMFYNMLPVAGTELILISIMIVAFNMIMFSSAPHQSVAVSLAGLVMTVFRMVPVINRSLTSLSAMNATAELVKSLMAEAETVGYADVDEEDALWSGGQSTAPLVIGRQLALRDLTFRYPGTDAPSLDHVSLTIPQGEFLGVIGASGAGKSTLIGVLLGFLPAPEGSFLVDDHRVDGAAIRAWRQAIGFVDQQAFIFDGSIRENVAFGVPADEIDDALVTRALQQAELWDFVAGLEAGAASPAGENGKLLSGGQRQRLVLARALYKQPSILILDEATSALDVETEYRISETIRALKGRVTIIAIAHRLSTLRTCDRLVVMEKGRIVESGDFDTLMRSSERFQAVVKMSNIVAEAGAAV